MLLLINYNLFVYFLEKRITAAKTLLENTDLLFTPFGNKDVFRF